MLFRSASVASDSVRPHRRQPTRLPRPWDSPGKNTGVGCHFPLQCMKVKSEREVASVASDSVRPQRWQPTRLPRPWDSPGKNTEVGCHFLPQCMNPGKNTGVGCHCLLQCRKVKSESEVVSDSVRPHRWQPTRLPCPWDSPGKNTEVGCHFLLQCMNSPPGSCVHGISQARTLE